MDSTIRIIQYMYKKSRRKTCINKNKKIHKKTHKHRRMDDGGERNGCGKRGSDWGGGGWKKKIKKNKKK